jgi:lipid-A-disaccharide synthase
MAGVPMVVAYKVSKLEEQLGRFIKVPSFVLANLVLGENVIPEFMQQNCTPEKLAAALLPLLRETPERDRQLAALERMETIMQAGDANPSDRAAQIVLEVIAERRQGTGQA